MRKITVESDKDVLISQLSFWGVYPSANNVRLTAGSSFWYASGVRPFLTLLLCLLPCVVLAQTLPPADLVTLTGKTYKAARVFRVEPDGITYAYTGGMSKIPFTDLPEAIRKQYGYDPKKAEAFANADAAQQDAIATAAKASQAAANQRTRALDAQRVSDSAAAKAAQTPPPKPDFGHTALDQGSYGQTGNIWTQKSGLVATPTPVPAPGKSGMFWFKASQVTDEGVLASIAVAEPAGGANHFPRPSDTDFAATMVFISCKPGADWADGMIFRASATQRGVHRYTTVLGAEKRVPSYELNGRIYIE